MLQMKDLPFPEIGAEPVQYTLVEDCLLDDSAFSNKPTAVAVAGDTLKLHTFPNYGIANHTIHGLFRY